MTGDETAVFRIQAYYPLMLVWWVARFARALYEIPRGLDERLVARDADWQREAQEKMLRYARRARKALKKTL